MDYTDLKRRPLAEWIEDFRSQESQGDDIPAWIPLMICEESAAAIAALEADVARVSAIAHNAIDEWASWVHDQIDGTGSLDETIADVDAARAARAALADQPAPHASITP